MKADERAERLSKELDGYSSRVKALGDALPEVGYGQRELTAQEHAQWFAMKSASDPAWALALPFVEGGKAELQRYNRARKRGV